MKISITFILMVLISCSPSQKNDGANQISDSAQVRQEIVEESEADETERVQKEKSQEDRQAYSELDNYDGTYDIITESDGVAASLKLTYSPDRTFTFLLELKALDICNGRVDGEIFMDRTQHGIYRTEGCFLHVNFMGNWDGGMVIEIEQEESCDKMKGDCIFAGTYKMQQQ